MWYEMLLQIVMALRIVSHMALICYTLRGNIFRFVVVVVQFSCLDANKAFD